MELSENETRVLTETVSAYVDRMTGESDIVKVRDLYVLATILRRLGDHELAQRVEESFTEFMASNSGDCKHCGQPGGH